MKIVTIKVTVYKNIWTFLMGRLFNPKFNKIYDEHEWAKYISELKNVTFKECTEDEDMRTLSVKVSFECNDSVAMINLVLSDLKKFIFKSYKERATFDSLITYKVKK